MYCWLCMRVAQAERARERLVGTMLRRQNAFHEDDYWSNPEVVSLIRASTSKDVEQLVSPDTPPYAHADDTSPAMPLPCSPADLSSQSPTLPRQCAMAELASQLLTPASTQDMLASRSEASRTCDSPTPISLDEKLRELEMLESLDGHDLENMTMPDDANATDDSMELCEWSLASFGDNVDNSLRYSLQVYYEAEKEAASLQGNIIWELQKSEAQAMNWLKSMLVDKKTYKHAKVGITTGPSWRMSGEPRQPGNSTRAHKHDFKRLFVIWFGEGKRCGRLESAAIERFGRHLVNEKPGGEGAKAGTPFFLYLAANTLAEMEEFIQARLRRKRARYSIVQ